MGWSFPVSHSDEETILNHSIDLDVETGQVESEGIMPTRNYDDRVGMAVDEFNLSEDGGVHRLRETRYQIEIGTRLYRIRMLQTVCEDRMEKILITGIIDQEERCSLASEE